MSRPRAVAQEIEGSDDPVQITALNRKFHEALYQPAGKNYALDLVRKMHSQIDRYVRLQPAESDPACRLKAQIHLLMMFWKCDSMPTAVLVYPFLNDLKPAVDAHRACSEHAHQA